MPNTLLKILKRPLRWLLSLLFLPFKLLISLVGNIISMIISIVLFIILLALIGMVLGIVPAPEFFDFFNHT